MYQNSQSLVKFSSLNLPDVLLRGVDELGFTACTPIQTQTLPLALSGKDVAGQAQTGTGKTAAFLLAIMNRCLILTPNPGRKKNQPLSLVVAPTRELAIQIHNDALKLGKYTDLKFGLVYGGADYEAQRLALVSGLDILIGTPGRLIDFLKQKVYDLKAIQTVVLDEADRMFDLGFIKDIRFLLRRMPPADSRLSMLFSATLSFRVTELAYEHMNNPEIIKVETLKITADKLNEVVYYTSSDEKISLLIGLLKKMDPSRTIIFVNTKRVAETLSAYLEGNGYEAAVLSGDIPQKRRQKYLEQFTSGELPILVATDVAARGLHIPEVSHVFNYDLPQDAEDYVHRIGRTARAGCSGDAISFACEKYSYSLPSIEEFIGYKIKSARITPELLADLAPPAAIIRSTPRRTGHGTKSKRPATSANRNRRNSGQTKPTRS